MNDVIVQKSDPILRRTADPVADTLFGTRELDDIVERMLAALDAEKDGVALAAPQIGIPLRIFVVRYDRWRAPLEGETEPEPETGVYINPEFVRKSKRRIEMDEGCLSVRRIFGKTMRHERATVLARLPDGSTFERGGGGVLAQIFQHEIDHLNGILFIDHATDLMEIEPEQMEQHRIERRERRIRQEQEIDHED